MALSTLGSSESEQMSNVTASSSRRVRELLALCFSSVEVGGFQDLGSLVTELVSSLTSLSESVASSASDEVEDDVIQVLADILKLLSSPQMDQAVIDALSYASLKVISMFANLSSRCLQLVEEIVNRFVEACNPRDMLSMICEALDAARCSLSLSSCSTPLLHGLAKVFISIQRRHYKQLKVAVPIVLNVLKDISLETDVQVEALFDKALGIAFSIREVSSKLEGEERAKVHCLLGLYVMQITAIFSVSIRDNVASCVPLVMQLEPFVRYCGLTHLGLITGSDTEKLVSTIAGDDDIISSFPDINLGASLLLMWTKISREGTDAALGSDVNELQSNPVKRWQAYGMLKYILSSGDLLWEFRRHAIEFLLDITEGVTSSRCNDEQIDCSQYTPSIYAALQAVTLVIMYAPDAGLRKKTFEALKTILSDIPAPERFDVLRALVTNSQSPSMTAILLGLVKDSMSKSSLQATDCETADTHVIELVELVLRPPEGGPPLLPDQSDAVLAALNLYRFALLSGSRGSEAGKEKSRGGSEVLSKKNLEKAYKEWLLPLRTLVSCSIAETLKEDHGHESSVDAVCLLNPIEMVLYRCIELVEERLKSP